MTPCCASPDRRRRRVKVTVDAWLYVCLDVLMNDNEVTYTTGQAAQRLGISVDTLRRWEREGKISPERNAAGHRRYTEADLDIKKSA